MGPTASAIPAWVTFVVERIITPIALHFNNHIRKLEAQNAQLTQRVYQLEQRWEALATALQPPYVITADTHEGARDVARAILKFINTFKPRPDPLTLPTNTPDQPHQPPNAPGA